MADQKDSNFVIEKINLLMDNYSTYLCIEEVAR